MERRTISREELRQLAEAHDAWARSDGTEGESEVLAGLDCEDADLSGLDLSEVVAINAHFPRASLRGTMMAGALLNRLSAPDADLREAVLTKANLRRAQIPNGRFQGAHLFRAELADADLRGADFSGADLRGATLNGSDLRGARFDGARMDIYTTFDDAQLDADPATFARDG